MITYKQYCIDIQDSLREAMKRLDEVQKKIIFVTDSGKLVASLTDGDLRRFLLKGGSLSEKAINAANKTPKFAMSINGAKKLLEDAQYVAVPLINVAGKIEDIVFSDNQTESKKYSELNVPVVIMAGGKGTRLDPYTKVLPKPLIPIGEKPIIEHIMHQFAEFGCSEFHIIVNYKKQLIKAYFSEINFPYKIYWYDEDKPLGTGGGLSLLKGHINQTFFLTNCDIIVNSDYKDILHFHKQHGNVTTMVCAYKNVVIPYGVVETAENGVIVNLKEKPEISFQTNTGVYVVEPEILNKIEKGKAVGFPDIISRKDIGKVAAYPISENDWLDMGQLDELERMRKRLSKT